MARHIHLRKYNRAFSSLGHDCELFADDDDIELKYPGNSCWAGMKRNLTRLILVDEKICKVYAIHLRSHGAIEREKKRQLSKYPTSIHPFSVMRIYWELAMIAIILILLFSLSLDLAFFYFDLTAAFFSSLPFLLIRTLLDLICCVDLIINSCTGYYDEAKKEVVLNHKQVFAHYLRTRFVVDLLTSIPTHFDLLVTVHPRSTGDGGVLMIALKMMQVFSMVKYLKYATFHRNLKKLAVIFNIDFYTRNGIFLVVTLIFFWIGLSSLRMFSYVVIEDDENIADYRNQTFYIAMTRALYDGALLIYTCSYGVISPNTNLEYMVIILLWLISRYVQIYFLARLLDFLKAKTSSSMKYTQMVKQLMEFMRHKQLPLYTQRRILSYYAYHFQNSYFRENEIYATISGQLRQEIMMQTCRRLVENVDFFKDLPLNLLVRIVSCMKSEIYLGNDLIIKAHTVGHCMYFIASGTVAVYTTVGKEICHLYDGAHFGEIALVANEYKRTASVLAAETCELYRLDRKDFVRAIQPYPDLMEKIQKIAMDRLEKTLMLDEFTKKQDVKKPTSW